MDEQEVEDFLQRERDAGRLVLEHEMREILDGIVYGDPPPVRTPYFSRIESYYKAIGGAMPRVSYLDELFPFPWEKPDHSEVHRIVSEAAERGWLGPRPTEAVIAPEVVRTLPPRGDQIISLDTVYDDLRANRYGTGAHLLAEHMLSPTFTKAYLIPREPQEPDDWEESWRQERERNWPDGQ